MTLNELEGFYTFITKTRFCYIVTYYVLETEIRNKLKALGLTDADVDALANTNKPNQAEADAYLNEAITALTNAPPVPQPTGEDIDPRTFAMVALNNTTPPITPMELKYWGTIFVQVNNPGDVPVKVKGKTRLDWFHPSGAEITYVDIDTTDWVDVTLNAPDAGLYYLQVEWGATSFVSVDIPGIPAGILGAKPGTVSADKSCAMDFNGSATYFYVPQWTPYFIFGTDSIDSGRPLIATITDPNGVQYQINDTVGTEHEFDSPIPGLWNVSGLSTGSAYGSIYLRNILPLFWHDPEFLLVPKWHSIRINAAAEGGTTRPDPGYIYTTAPGTYSNGKTFVLVAIPSPDYSFVQWNENGSLYSADNPIWLPCSEDHDLTPVFVYSPPSGSYAITISASSGGTTNPEPGRITLLEGNQLSIEAKPDDGYKFDHWEGDVTGTDSLVTITVTKTMSIIAVFSPNLPPTVSYTVNIGSSVGGHTNPPTGEFTVLKNSQYDVEAIPDDGYRFDHWSGDISGTDGHITITVEKNISIVAVFVPLNIPPSSHVGWGIAVATGVITVAAIILSKRSGS